MADSISIEVHSYSWTYIILVVLGVIVMIVWFFAMFWALSVWMVVLYCLLLVAFIAYCWFYEKTPTVISADSTTLRWRHMGKSKKITLSEIRNITCEPYFVRNRYSTSQRIRLLVWLSDDESGDIEFTDAVNSHAMLEDMVSGKQSDIPLVRMYHYLKEQTGL